MIELENPPHQKMQGAHTMAEKIRINPSNGMPVMLYTHKNRPLN
jgi:hypothetical protein